MSCQPTHLRHQSASNGVGTRLPPGVHRGALAGLTGEERERAIMEHHDRYRSSSEPETYRNRKRSLYGYHPTPVGVRNVGCVPDSTFASCLQKVSKDTIVRLLGAMGVRRVSALRKQQVVKRLLQEIDKLPQAIEAMLTTSTDSEFEGFKLLMEKPDGMFVFTEDDGVRIDGLASLEPLIWVFHCKGAYHAIMPQEVWGAARSVDMEKIQALRDRTWQVPVAAEVLREFCGVASIDDVIWCCKELYGFEPSKQDVVTSLRSHSLGRSDWECGSARYYYCWPNDTPSEDGFVVHRHLTDAYADDVARSRANWHRRAVPYRARVAWADGEPATSDYASFQSKERSARDGLIRRLLSDRSQGIVPAHPVFDSALASLGAPRWVGSLPEMVAVISWLDEHVPNDKDDYEYADDIADALVYGRHDSPNPFYMLQIAWQHGLFSHTYDSGELIRLLVDLESVLPSWRLNGWSPRAYHEWLAETKADATEEVDRAA
ncbi:hypothetical protein B5F74_04720 [Collinsella sp. An271]|uniref:hypothetical protein n=1 Tax=Collinsella sp. An271 TaxID=1965616 RepID=UPI000B3AA48D|nr:hypothetical protein [Collinsella sp. An271]OUO61434.1 hypothetical protein B5F74_04720 [Collinsella sp. An271]